MFGHAYASLQYPRANLAAFVCMFALLCLPLGCCWPFPVAFALGFGQGKTSFWVSRLIGLFLFAFDCFCHGPVPMLGSRPLPSGFAYASVFAVAACCY